MSTVLHRLFPSQNAKFFDAEREFHVNTHHRGARGIQFLTVVILHGLHLESVDRLARLHQLQRFTGEEAVLQDKDGISLVVTGVEQRGDLPVADVHAVVIILTLGIASEIDAGEVL